MEKKVNSDFFTRKVCTFYENFEVKSPLKVAVLIVITLGFYAIQMIYDLNKKFELCDDEAPSSNRCLFVMLFFPSFWAYVTFLHQFLFHTKSTTFLFILIIIWALLIFLMITYLYDFCTIFAKYTRSNEKFWYYSLFPTFLGFTLATIGYYIWAFFFLVVSLSVLPTMQRELNRRYFEYRIYNQRNYFNAMGRKQVG